MLLNEIITKAQYTFLQIWYSCRWVLWDEYPESIFMVRGDEVLFEQDWKNKTLWCRYSILWSFFESEFGYNDMQINEMISSLLEEHLKQGHLTPTKGIGREKRLLEEHLKQGHLTPRPQIIINRPGWKNISNKGI